MPTRHVSLAATILFAAPVLAQTTWSSFEDRKGHAIASDPTGGVLMFGGESSVQAGEYLQDTNAFSRSGSVASWTQLAATGSPRPRTEHAMAAGTNSTDTAIFILFGGLAEPSTGGPAVPSGETFVFEGGWGASTISVQNPSPRTGHAMVTDTRRNRVVLFGGFSAGVPMDDTWEFDPLTEQWTELTIQGALPPGRFNHCMAYHPGPNAIAGRVYVYGGSGFRADTWELDPLTLTWTDKAPAAPPTGRTGAAMAFHPLTDRLVMFGGQTFENSMLTPKNDTWIYDRGANTWIQASPLAVPPARLQHAMAPDQLGSFVILHGGEDGNGDALAGTWLWNGGNWSEEIVEPAPRLGVAMTYDRARDRHPAFGGRDATTGTELDDTWELDGLNWRERNPANRPSARADAGIVYDSLRQRTVLYGGRTGGLCGTFLGDTWEWDGQNWAPRVLANNPPPAGGVQPVFDTKRGVTWLLVGDQMWSYDGSDWTRSATPSGRSFFGYSYDPGRNRFVIAGGLGGAPTETYEWDGVRWQRVTTMPQHRFFTSMAHHTATGRDLLFGGTNGATTFGDTWTWDGTFWTLQNQMLPSRISTALAYDTSRQVVVGFGGVQNFNLTDETLEWNGSAWAVAAPATSPPAREGAGLAYDPVRGEIVLFGGACSSGTCSDTWTYDGSTWTLAAAAGTGPSGRAHTRMAFDVHTQNVLLFAGLTSLAPSYDDQTWLWNGTSWAQQLPNASPPARFAHALFSTGSRTLMWGGESFRYYTDMWEWDGQEWQVVGYSSPDFREDYGAAYDARRDRVVIFGGRKNCGTGSFLNGTWEWDGEAWQRRFPNTTPSPRERARLCYDETRGRVVLFGGTDGTVSFSDTWEWDGEDWIQRLPITSPPSSGDHGLTFDASRRLTVTFGAVGTWDYGPVDAAAIEPFGSGCAGSNGTPVLEPKPWAGPWLGDRLEVDFVNQPPGLGLFVWGFSDQFWLGQPLPFSLAPFGGGPGCDLLVSDDLHELFLSGTNPYVSFQLPNVPSFVGTVMFGQAGFLDTGLGGAPVTSNALRLTFGSR